MSYVLILQPSGRDRWPAVIGGYRTRDEAAAAGRYACADPQTRDLTPEEYEQWIEQQDGGWVVSFEWRTYTVIPGAASQGPDHP